MNALKSALLNKLTVAFRMLVEHAMNFIGCLNITPLLISDKSARKKIAFQAYDFLEAQFYQTIIPELLKEPDKFQIIFIVLPHPYYPLESTLKLKKFAHSKLCVPRENIKFYWEVLWDKFDLTIYADMYAKFPLRKTKKYLLNHGPGIHAGMIKKGGWYNKTIFDFDLIFLAGDEDLKLIKKIVILIRFHQNSSPQASLFLTDSNILKGAGSSILKDYPLT